jgi:hypothetical protein
LGESIRLVLIHVVSQKYVIHQFPLQIAYLDS